MVVSQEENLGPTQNRSCTDIICLFIFGFFIMTWILLGVFAFQYGDPNVLFVPRDTSGKRCGLDFGVENKPYLYFQDLTKCLGPNVVFTGCRTPQICVSNCPQEIYVHKPNGVYSGKKEYCDGLTCPNWYLPSEPVQYRCIPGKINATKEILSELSDVILDNILKGGKAVKEFSEVEQVGQQIAKDLINSWLKIVVGIVVAVLISLLYICLLRWIAGVMVWITIALVLVFLSAGVYFAYAEYSKIPNSDKNQEKKKNLWLAVLISLSSILVIVVLLLLFLRKRILLAIALVKEGSKAVSSTTCILIFPIFPWTLKILVIGYAIIVSLYLTTTGDPIYKIRDCGDVSKENTECNPYNFTSTICTTTSATCKFIGTTELVYYMYAQAFNIFACLWAMFFISALGQMILAGVFAQWYWTRKKSALPFFAVTEATIRVVRYHIGTVAFGSLIITICRMVRLGLEYADHKLKKYDNQITKAILCCLKCFFWCLEKFLKFVNKNAYIMCAIHGKNFCASAKDAFWLLLRNIVRVVVLDKVTDFVFFISKIFVTVGIGGLAYMCFVTNITGIDNTNITFKLIPVVFLMVITYIIASLFFNVYSMAVDTLFLCFLKDCELNDGSDQKPYYMTKNLMGIFGKKNKTV